jgi:predicted ATP-grasp superfamily ATP-dependent carboligase
VSQSPRGVVVKPRFGAGCIDTFFCANAGDFAALPPRNDYIVQPWIEGTACSAAFLVQGVRITPLRAGQQTIRRPSPTKLGYGGGRIPLAPDLEARALSLGEKAVRSIPGLHGFVGVDLILGATPVDDRVIELNPRPTVAYVGLRQLAAVNLIERLLNPGLPIAWNPLGVSYTSDGQITRL